MEPLTATYYNAEQRTWSGPKRKALYNKDITLGEVMHEALRKNSHKVIQIHDQTGEKLTCGELLLSAEALSRNLLRLGLRPGDVIGLYANNWNHVATVMLASFLCGTPVNAIYPGFDLESASLIYSTTKPKIIFCEVENCEIAQSVSRDLDLNAPVYVVNGSVEGDAPHIDDLLQMLDCRLGGENFRFPCLDLKGTDTAMILCSSGTTGIPKGVLCSNEALLNQTVYLTLTSESVVFSFSTMYWASGLWTLIASLINANLRIVTCKQFTPEYFLHLVRQYKITHLVGGGTQMAELSMYENVEEIQKSLESIDSMIIGGAKVPLVVQEKLNTYLAYNKKRPGFSVAYGMSELSGMLSINSGYPMQRLEGSEGKLVANTMVRIISKEGERLDTLQHGEICIKTPFAWQGYYNNPEATLKAQRNNWLYTGDIGFFDEEGFLHVCGRDNDVFKSWNFQIYPPLIEDVVLRLAGVAETCVFGIPDFVASHLTACVVVRAADEEGQNLTAKEVDQHVKVNMGSMYHISGGVYFMDALPKTGSGKVQKRKVLELVMKMKEKK